MRRCFVFLSSLTWCFIFVDVEYFAASFDVHSEDMRFTSCHRKCSRRKCTWHVSYDAPSAASNSHARVQTRVQLTCHHTGKSQTGIQCIRPGTRGWERWSGSQLDAYVRSRKLTVANIVLLFVCRLRCCEVVGVVVGEERAEEKWRRSIYVSCWFGNSVARG